MPFTLTMPKLSPTMEGGTIVKWHKKKGDQVKENDLLFEVATDKATVEYNAIDGGFLREILIKEGESAEVNQAVAIFTVKKEESIEGYKPEGISIKEEAPIAASEKKQAHTAPSASRAAGLSQPAFTPEMPLANYAFEWPTEAQDPLRASPLAKKLAREKGIDLTSIKGSGPAGRVVSRDLDRGAPDQVVTFGRFEHPTIPPGSYKEEALTPMRAVIAERLQSAKTFIPHFYVQQQVNVGRLVDLREQLKSGNLKVSFNDFILRAAALALKEHPAINSGFNSAHNQIIRFQTVDIAVAVSVEGGLITPIVRHADYKNVGQIAAEVKSLAAAAKAGKLKPEEYKGGSFTVSNLGMYGISDFQAIINPPQAAILAVGGIIEQPVIEEGMVKVGKTLMLSLSSDHRVIDGADAAQFLKTVQRYLENPGLLLV